MQIQFARFFLCFPWDCLGFSSYQPINPCDSPFSTLRRCAVAPSQPSPTALRCPSLPGRASPSALQSRRRWPVSSHFNQQEYNARISRMWCSTIVIYIYNTYIYICIYNDIYIVYIYIYTFRNISESSTKKCSRTYDMIFSNSNQTGKTNEKKSKETDDAMALRPTTSLLPPWAPSPPVHWHEHKWFCWCQNMSGNGT